MNEIPIYPDVKIDIGPGIEMDFMAYRTRNLHRAPCMVFRTYIRLKRKGTWYLQLVRNNYEISEDDFHITQLRYLIQFNKNVYMAQKLGKIDIKAIDVDKCKLYVIDEDQSSEEERLKKLIES